MKRIFIVLLCLLLISGIVLNGTIAMAATDSNLGQILRAAVDMLADGFDYLKNGGGWEAGLEFLAEGFSFLLKALEVIW